MVLSIGLADAIVKPPPLALLLSPATAIAIILYMHIYNTWCSSINSVVSLQYATCRKEQEEGLILPQIQALIGVRDNKK